MHKRKKIDPEERRLQAVAFRAQRRLEESLQELQNIFDAAAKPAPAKAPAKPAAKPAVKAPAKAEVKPVDKAHEWASPIYTDGNAFPYWEDEEDYHWQDKRW